MLFLGKPKELRPTRESSPLPAATTRDKMAATRRRKRDPLALVLLFVGQPLLVSGGGSSLPVAVMLPPQGKRCIHQVRL